MASTENQRIVSRKHSCDSGNESLKEGKARSKDRIEMSKITGESFLSTEPTRYTKHTGGNSETLYIISSHANEIKSNHILETSSSKDLALQDHRDGLADSSPDIPTNILVLPQDEISDLADFGVHACDQTKIIEPPPQSPQTFYPNYEGQTARWSGCGQIGFGTAAVACQAVAIRFSEPTEYKEDGYNYFATGIWCGAFFVLTGVVCLLSARYKTRKMINGNLILSGLSCGLFCVCLFVMSCIGLFFINESKRYSCNNEDPTDTTCSMSRPLLIVHAILLVTALLDFAVTFKMAVHCYKTLFKNKTTSVSTKASRRPSDKSDSSGQKHSSVALKDSLYQAGLNSPRRSDTTSVSSRRSRSAGASRTPTDGVSNEGYEADDSFGTLNSMSSHWSTLTKSDHESREGNSLNGEASHRRTSSQCSFSSVESNCVVIKLPDPFDKITALGQAVPKRPYYNSNEDPDFGIGKTLLGDCSNSDVISSGRSVTDSAYEEMSVDSVSSPEYPRVIVNESDISDNIIMSGPIRL